MDKKTRAELWRKALPERALEGILGLAWVFGLLFIASAREGLTFSFARAFILATALILWQSVPVPEGRGWTFLRTVASVTPWLILFRVGWVLQERLVEESFILFPSLLGSGVTGDVGLATTFFAAFCALLWAFLVWDAPLSYGPGLFSLAILVLLPLAGQRPGYGTILFLVLPSGALLFLPRSRLRGLAWVLAALLVALPLGLALSGPIEDGVYTLESLRYRATASRDGGVVFTGVINRGNVYRNGIPQLRLTFDRQPEEPLYLKAFTGASYSAGAWQAEDETAYQEALSAVWPNSQWAERLEHLPELLNLLQTTTGAMNLSDQRLRMEVAPLPNAGQQRVVPYYAMETEREESVTSNTAQAAEAYSYLFWEKSDMRYRWQEDQSRYADWYQAMLSARQEINKRYLSVPMAQVPRLTELTAGHEGGSLEATTAFILYTLQTQAEYTRNPGQGSIATADDPIESFLFERHRGYCQQYASAAALMYRLCGVPARYVEGYRVEPGDVTLTEDGAWQTEVSDENAHAWVELFLPDYGWTPIEVTPTDTGDFVTDLPGVTLPDLLGRVEMLRRSNARQDGQGAGFAAWDSEDALRAAWERNLGRLRVPWQRALVTIVIYAFLAAVSVVEWRRKDTKISGTEERSMNQARLVVREVNRVILGKDETVREVMLAILAGGHVLLEDAPGVGKTMLALAFSRAMGLEMKRVQFTPDVLPSDLTGFSVYHKEEERMVFQPGAIFCNLLLADEINRTSPKTQSALLEVMEEKQVSVDGYTWSVPQPFIVLATQNPHGSVGTQALPDTELDRFIVSLSLGYPDKDAEMELAREDKGERREVLASPILTADGLAALQADVHLEILPEDVNELLVELIRRTRNHPDLAHGASPRATLALVRMAKASAYLEGRAIVSGADVLEQFIPVAAHRVELTAEARRAGKTPESVLREIVAWSTQP